jgi:hypothetical protein
MKIKPPGLPACELKQHKDGWSEVVSGRHIVTSMQGPGKLWMKKPGKEPDLMIDIVVEGIYTFDIPLFIDKGIYFKYEHPHDNPPKGAKPDIEPHIKVAESVFTATDLVLINKLPQQWCQITYAIPAKKEKERRLFLQEARAAGAMMFTQSVYMLPFTTKAFFLAQHLAKTVTAYLWIAMVSDPEQQEQLTLKYMNFIATLCAETEERLHRATAYWNSGIYSYERLAEKMRDKTALLISTLVDISEYFEFPWLQKQITAYWKSFKEIYTSKDKTAEN